MSDQWSWYAKTIIFSRGHLEYQVGYVPMSFVKNSKITTTPLTIPCQISTVHHIFSKRASKIWKLLNFLRCTQWHWPCLNLMSFAQYRFLWVLLSSACVPETVVFWSSPFPATNRCFWLVSMCWTQWHGSFSHLWMSDPNILSGILFRSCSSNL